MRFTTFCRLQENTKALQQAVSLQPDDDLAWLALADALEEAGQIEQAAYVRLATQDWLVRFDYEYMADAVYAGQISLIRHMPVPALFALLSHGVFYELVGGGIVSTEDQNTIQSLVALAPPMVQANLRLATLSTRIAQDMPIHRFRPPLDQVLKDILQANSPNLTIY